MNVEAATEALKKHGSKAADGGLAVVMLSLFFHLSGELKNVETRREDAAMKIEHRLTELESQIRWRLGDLKTQIELQSNEPARKR